MDDIEPFITYHGSLERHEILELGWNDARIARAVRAGTLERIRYGTYVHGPTWRAASAAERLRMRTRAVLDKLGRHVYATHHSAAALHGIELWGVDLDRVHLGRLDGRTGRIDAGVHYHQGTLNPADLVEIDGLLTVPVERAVIESALISTAESGMVVATSAMRRHGLERGQLVDTLEKDFSHWPGAYTADWAIRRADPRLESIGEVRSMHLFTAFALPHPEPQAVIRDAAGRFLARTDFTWQLYRHVGEFDGLVKYGRLNPYETDVGRVLADEKFREDAIRAQLYGVSRWTWAELEPTVRQRTATRLRRDLERSRKLYVDNRTVIDLGA